MESLSADYTPPDAPDHVTHRFPGNIFTLDSRRPAPVALGGILAETAAPGLKCATPELKYIRSFNGRKFHAEALFDRCCRTSESAWKNRTQTSAGPALPELRGMWMY